MKDGKAYIVEFNKKETSFDSPLNIRIDSKNIINLCKYSHFSHIEEVDISANLYGIILGK